MQMQMDCDGASVKIPWIRFDVRNDDGSMPVDYDAATENTMPGATDNMAEAPKV
jgi:hypothetical protein